MNSLSLGSIVGKKAKQNKTKQLDWGGKKAGVTSVRDRNERDHSLSPRFFSARTDYSLLNEDMIVAAVIAI